MKKFLLHTLPFVAVIFLYIGIGEYLMYRIRENIPVSIAVKEQAHSKKEFYYHRTLFDNVSTTYKYEMLQEKKASIVALGQSIVFNFRDFFFHPFEAEFYNTGLMARNIYDFEYFAKLLKEGTVKKPSFMVVGIDHGLVTQFNDLDKKKWLENLDPDPVYNYKEHLRAIQDMYLKSDVREVPDLDLGIGKRGMVGNGYRKDGSFTYKWELENFMKDSIHLEGPLVDNFKQRSGAFQLPMDVSIEKQNLLIKILNDYRNMGIEMVIYFPPLTDTFYNFAIQDKIFKNFWTKYTALQDILEAQGFDVIRFVVPSQMGLSDFYMNNANHPGDILVAKQFLQYCKSSNRKGKFVDKVNVNYLDSLLKATDNPLSFMQDTLTYSKEWYVK